jgi:hypothetical protein
MSVNRTGESTVVNDDSGWFPLYTGDPATVAAVRAELDRRRIASRLDHPISVRGDGTRRSLTVMVAGSDLGPSRIILRDVTVASSSAAGASAARSSDATRVLCGNVLLSGSVYRQLLLAGWRRKGGAVAPELGVDTSLVARVCTYLEQREVRYEMISVAILLLGYYLLPFLPMPYGLFAPFVTAFILSAVFFTKRFEEKWTLTQPLMRDAWDPDEVARQFPAELDPDVREGIADAEQNAVVYGNFRPFVGSGRELDSWSFVVDTTKPAADALGMVGAAAPVAFETAEVYDAALGAIEALQVPAMEIRDTLFSDGRHVRGNRDLMPNVYGRPLQRVSGAVIDRHRANDDDPYARWYPWIRVYDVEQEIVLSMFLRFRKQGKHLFLEMSRHLLTPVADAHRRIDDLPAKGIFDVLKMLTAALLFGTLSALLDAFMLVKRGSSALLRLVGYTDHLHVSRLRQNPRFNHGAGTSMRENAASGVFTRHFQKMDTMMFVKMLDAELLDVIVRFLEKHNIDTSELKEQRALVLNNNNGVFVQGDLKNSSVAAGASTATNVVSQLRSLGHRARQAAKGVTT